MKIRNLVNRNNKLIANQIVIDNGNKTIFESHGKRIAMVDKSTLNVTLDTKAFKYSNTTTYYLAQFLGYDSTKKLKDNTSNFKYANLNF